MTLATSILRPVVIPSAQVGQAAPCDLYNAGGVLLLRAGAPLAKVGQDTAQPLRFYCTAECAARISDLDPTCEIGRIALALGEISGRVAGGENVSAGELQRLARDLLEIWTFDADACLGYARLNRSKTASIDHAIHVALLALELGGASGVPRDRLATLAGAGLSMNLTRFALHDEMFNLSGAPDQEQLRGIGEHPFLSAMLLDRIGKGCENWVPAVIGHHENIDGSGYPAQLKGPEIPLTARILRIADTLAARLTGRKARAPLYWNLHYADDLAQLTQHVFGADIGLLDKTLVNQLMRALGPFPPGSLVRLSNQELALVTRRGFRGAAKPRQVLAIADGSGRILPTPVLRKTGSGALSIRAYAHDDPRRNQVRHWSDAWGYTH